MTAPRYMLDTNILSDLVRQPQGQIAQHIAQVGEDVVCTSIIVAAELRFGAAKRASARLTQQVETILGVLPVLPFDAPADAAYADIRQHLAQAGQPIGPNDLLIAAHARSLGCILVTANTREFARVPDLPLVNWLAQ